MAVPGAIDAAGRKVLTFIAKDPPGQRCNGNLQMAAEIANVYRVPIQLLPSSLAPGLPAPAVFFGDRRSRPTVATTTAQASFQMVATCSRSRACRSRTRQGCCPTKRFARTSRPARHDQDRRQVMSRHC